MKMRIYFIKLENSHCNKQSILSMNVVVTQISYGNDFRESFGKFLFTPPDFSQTHQILFFTLKNQFRIYVSNLV
jgi:hypothetical protein